ncbi:hypothetical protein ACFE04_008140 [Oxalis oulophora]
MELKVYRRRPKGTTEQITALEIYSNNVENDVLASSPKSKPTKLTTKEILEWLTKTAKSPTDPILNPLPHISKWDFQPMNKPWKQLWLYRNKFFKTKSKNKLINKNKKKKKKKKDPYAKKMKNFFNDSYLLTQEESDSVRLGEEYQVEVPEWSDKVSRPSNSKWLGTQIWPADDGRLIGKGLARNGIRVRPCGCNVPGSMECARLHVSEKKEKMKLELGSAFGIWKLDKMGKRNSECFIDEEKWKTKLQYLYTGAHSKAKQV